jgi:hypothetical protein
MRQRCRHVKQLKIKRKNAERHDVEGHCKESRHGVHFAAQYFFALACLEMVPACEPQLIDDRAGCFQPCLEQRPSEPA